MKEKRGAWASNIGFILAAAGSAIGLGNIWKFPGKVGTNGGGTFILVYLLMIVFIGFSIVLAEVTIGRKTKKNSVAAFRDINPKWSFAGKFGLLSSFIVLSYYSVVGGWVLKYITTYIGGADFGESTSTYFTEFISQPIEPLLWHFLFMALTVGIIIRGVSSGIEKVSKILMPLLFIILISITIRSITLPGADEGLRFLTTITLSDITPHMIVVALGQAFFSLSLGMSIMITYGSYVSSHDNLPKSVTSIVILDTFIALLAGFAIVCSVFATDPSLIGGQGGGFAFISLPNVFASIPGGTFFGMLFFILLFFAALTSSMSILEGMVAFVTEEFSISRTKSALILGSLMALIGCAYSLSQGAIDLRLPWYDFVNGFSSKSVGDIMEYLTDNLLMPLTALFICIFVGWIWKPDNAIVEIRAHDSAQFKIAPVWKFIIRYICPIAIIIILFTTLIRGEGIS